MLFGFIIRLIIADFGKEIKHTAGVLKNAIHFGGGRAD